MPPPPWLFKVREPGVATAVRTAFVRPGGQYVMLASDIHPDWEQFGEVLSLTTRGVHAVRFAVPSEVDEAVIRAMRDHGLGVVSDVAVWPAGLVPAGWDGEGRAVWPSGESPVIGVRTSRTAARCVVSTEVDVLEFPWPQGTDTAFVELQELGPGVHLVEVAVLGDGDSGAIAQGQLEARVLEPVDSASAAGGRQGLQARCHPVRPSLEELWTGNASVVADGPRGEKVQFDLSLLDRGGRRVLARAAFSSALPVSEVRWHELLRGVQGSNEFAAAYPEAEELTVRLTNDVLGTTDIRAERPFSPMRWVSGHDRHGPYARLIDHLGSEELVLQYFDAPTPAVPEEPTIDSDHRVRTSNGGLIVARAGMFRAAAVLPPHITGGFESLRKLNVRPSLQTGPRSVASIHRMIELGDLWCRRGVPSDDNAAHLQDCVNAAIVARVGGVIAGPTWWEFELDVLDGRMPARDKLIEAVGRSPDERRLATRLLELSEIPRDDVSADVESFGDALAAPPTRVTRSASEALLRLATIPGTLVEKDVTHDAIEQALQRPALFRLARLFVLGVAQQDEERRATLRRWQWV